MTWTGSRFLFYALMLTKFCDYFLYCPRAYRTRTLCPGSYLTRVLQVVLFCFQQFKSPPPPPTPGVGSTPSNTHTHTHTHTWDRKDIHSLGAPSSGASSSTAPPGLEAPVSSLPGQVFLQGQHLGTCVNRRRRRGGARGCIWGTEVSPP